MNRSLPLLAGAIVLLLSGVVHGLWIDRWTQSAALDELTGRLADLPTKIGTWEGQPVELDPRQLAISEAAGHLSRRYVQRRTGAEVSIVVLCGRPGPLSVHQPDVCYTGSGYQQAGRKEKWEAPADSAARGTSFWTARFVRPGADPAPLRVFWAWSAAGDWTAADKPRITFGRMPALCKLYVVRRMARPDEPLNQDPSRAFLELLVPTLRQTLAGELDRTPADHLVASYER